MKLIEQIGSAHALRRSCSSRLDASVQSSTEHALRNEEVDDLVPIEGQLEAVAGVEGRFDEILVVADEVLENDKSAARVGVSSDSCAMEEDYSPIHHRLEIHASEVDDLAASPLDGSPKPIHSAQ